MGGKAAVPLSLVGPGRSGLCLALGRRRMVDVGRRDRQRRGDRAVPPAADFPHGHSRRDGGKQAAAGRKLPPHSGGVRAACRHDQISVRQPAIAGRFCLVRPAQRDGDRSDADADHAGASAVYRSLGAAAGRCLRRRGRMVSARTGARRNGRGAAENCRRTLSAVSGRQRRGLCKGVERLEINVWGLPYALSPFKYQVKCLQLLREKFAALDARTGGVAAGAGAHRVLGSTSLPK